MGKIFRADFLRQCANVLNCGDEDKKCTVSNDNIIYAKKDVGYFFDRDNTTYCYKHEKRKAPIIKNKYRIDR